LLRQKVAPDHFLETVPDPVSASRAAHRAAHTRDGNGPAACRALPPRRGYTAGQRVLDATGNLKAAQALLGHASISTTADTYTDWDVQQLESSLLQTFAVEDGEE
jgi:site-specific recombinase XerC